MTCSRILKLLMIKDYAYYNTDSSETRIIDSKLDRLEVSVCSIINDIIPTMYLYIYIQN